MERRQYRRNTYAVGEEDPQTSSENGGSDSPLSGDDPGVTTATATAPSPKKSRRSIQKRVVSVPIADVEGSSSSRSGRGEAYPPSDSWAWRKYGQKPIKGSPYPRGYYRCSSSKGCPARKQVERSRVDPTMLVITYASEHNHPQPTSSKHHHLHHHQHHSSSASAAATNRTAADRDSSPSPAASPTNTTPSPPRNRTKITITNNKHNINAKEDDGLINNSSTTSEESTQDDREEKPNLFPGPNDLELCGDHTLMDFSWLSEVAFEGPSYVGPRCIIDDAHDVGISSYMDVKMREEDEKLFADLDELPECSAVFRSATGSRGVDRCNQLGAPAGTATSTASVCGGTG